MHTVAGVTAMSEGMRECEFSVQGAVLITVGRSYIGNDVTHSTLLDRAFACSDENLPKYRSYRVSIACGPFIFITAAVPLHAADRECNVIVSSRSVHNL